jgi:excisionase family DNA binding protein
VAFFYLMCIMASQTATIPTVSEADQTTLLDREEMGRRLGVSTATVDRWAADGTIPAIRCGRSVRFHWPTVLQKLLADRDALAAPHQPPGRTIELI